MVSREEHSIRILILDHHTLFRSGLRLIFNQYPGFEIVGETGVLSEGIELISSLNPDIILLEPNLVGQSGSDLIPSLLRASDKARVILVTGTIDTRVHQKAVEDGVMGVVFKTQSQEILIKAIQKVYEGEVWLERSLIATVLRRSHHQFQQDPEKESIAQLSDREIQVISLIGQGYKNKKISNHLYISETTVRHHLTSIYGKLGVSDRLELLVFAHRNGLVKSINQQPHLQ